MPSPKWSTSSGPLIAAGIAAAVHHAWEQPEGQRNRAFHEALRKALGPDVYERVQFQAHAVWLLQRSAPEDVELPPPWSYFSMCPGCMALRKTRHTQPQNGRTKLQVLRDADWLQQQLEAGRTTTQIAKRLDCSPSLVVDWCAKHGIQTERAKRIEEIEATVQRMHAEGEGPGTIAKVLGGGMSSTRVREVLKRLGLANQKTGQVYHERDWWLSRLEAGKTKLDCTREAGIKPHAGTFWIHKFGLERFTVINDKARKRRKKYPILANKDTLRELLARHDHNYEKAAEEVGCSPSLVSRYARDLLGLAKKHENGVTHGTREWWTERLDRGMTTYELAEEAGIAEKTARERCRIFDLLPQAYHNNAQRERENRKNREAA